MGVMIETQELVSALERAAQEAQDVLNATSAAEGRELDAIGTMPSETPQTTR